MAFDGALPTRETYLPQIRIEVVPNRFARAPVLDGDVKVHDRLALLFGYASVGVGIGVGTGVPIVTSVVTAVI